MICPTCKGGKTLLKKEQGKGCYEVVLGICDRCHGTGEVEMTNEEWFCSLSTEEKAKYLACEFTVACDEYAYFHNKETWDENYWVEWLKEIHNEMQIE